MNRPNRIRIWRWHYDNGLWLIIILMIISTRIWEWVNEQGNHLKNEWASKQPSVYVRSLIFPNVTGWCAAVNLSPTHQVPVTSSSATPPPRTVWWRPPYSVVTRAQSAISPSNAWSFNPCKVSHSPWWGPDSSTVPPERGIPPWTLATGEWVSYQSFSFRN